jgi:16S rRNA (guanine527-N7)-methyltransferase
MMEKLITGAARLGIKLSPGQLEQFETYYRELVAWNQRLNLTAITGYEEVQVKHFLDSLTVVLAWPKPPGEKYRVIDVGTGAGLPGIPLKIAFPEIRLTLLEATKKKAGVLEHLKTALCLNDIEIVVGRAEEAAHQERFREQFDLVLSRAVAGLPALAEITLPFCKVGGRFIAWKKGDIEAEVAAASHAISLLGGHLHEVKSLGLEELPDRRCLVVIDKTSSTPGIYPRRPGQPTRRPLK